MNKSLEDFVNPPIAGKKELHIGSQVFRVGDKILQNKNTEMASNGDLGRILDCITDEDGNARAVIGSRMGGRCNMKLTDGNDRTC